MSNPLYAIHASVEKLQSTDSDLRFMAFSDLHSILCDKSTESIGKDRHLINTVCDAVLDKLNDPITEVQNQAVKW